MLTKVRGPLVALAEESAVVGVGPFELEVLIPESARRALQSRIGETVALDTVCYLEGGQMSARLTPRLVGFLSSVDREFFDVFCSVDGVGPRKALRAMVRPVRDLARMIQDQKVKELATFPGIGEATAERIVAKLRRKVGKFALIIGPGSEQPGLPGGGDGAAPSDVVADAYAALLSVGHSESQAREAIDRAQAGKKTFKSVADLIEAIYRQSQ